VEVRKESAGGTVVYRVKGKLDASTASGLDSAIVVNQESSRVILDMRDVTYVSSAGLRVIVQAARRAQAAKGGFALFGLQASVKEVFDAAGFGNIVPIASDETEARSKLAG
jgi:anti-anti-sigma factor